MCGVCKFFDQSTLYQQASFGTGLPQGLYGLAFGESRA
jgi:hypothetical protein